MIFAGWEVRMVKNCDLGLENAQYKTSVTVFHHTDLPAGKYHIFLIAAVCSFPRKIKIVIYMVQAVPRSTKGPGGTKTAINPI